MIRSSVAKDASFFFATTGWLVGIVLFITLRLRIALGAFGWMFTQQLLAIVLVVMFSIAITLYQEQLERAFKILCETFFGQSTEKIKRVVLVTSKGLVVCGLVIYAAVIVALTVLDHRLLLVLIAVAQAGAWAALRGWRGPYRMAITAAAITGWVLTAGLTYTHLTDLLLNAGSSESLFVAAFSAALLFVTAEWSAPASLGKTFSRPALISVVLLCATFAFRTDNFLSDWIPYHRSYFTDVADMVRSGHWLLYDVPSLYGFLSILAIAAVPARDGNYALFLLTGVFLTGQAVTVFLILAWNRRTPSGYLCASLFAVGTVLTDQISRYAWSPRLYPQGGMRFEWNTLLLFICFLKFVYRADTKKQTLLNACGTALWLVAVFWSFETGIWATIVWGGDALLTFLTSSSSFAERLKTLARRGASMLLLFLIAAAFIAEYYRLRLGTFPDIRAFVEYTAIFTKGEVRTIFWVQPYGAGWTLLLVLGSCFALALRAINERAAQAFALLATAWLALWTASSYFAVEPLDEYVGLLLPSVAITVAVVVYVSRELPLSVASLCSRVALAPLAIIAIATFVGEPSRLASMRWDFRFEERFPIVHGELQEALERAGVKPGDRVSFPYGSSWTELQQGLILPYSRDGSGKIRKYASWLPISPVGPWNLYEALPDTRKNAYVDRFLNLSHQGGWLVTYRTPAKCSDLSPRLKTESSSDSKNFSIALCTYVNKSETVHGYSDTNQKVAPQ